MAKKIITYDLSVPLGGATSAKVDVNTPGHPEAAAVRF